LYVAVQILQAEAVAESITRQTKGQLTQLDIDAGGDRAKNLGSVLI
jgi:hypothetical protein